MQMKHLSSGFLCAMRIALLQLEMLLSRMDRAANWVTREMDTHQRALRRHYDAYEQRWYILNAIKSTPKVNLSL